MSLNGIQTGVQTSVEVVSMQFSSSSQTNGCRANQGLQFNDQQVQDVFNRLSQAFNSGGCESNAANGAGSPDSQEGANPIKDLLEKIVSMLKELKEQAAPNNQTPQTGGNGEGGGNFLEKLLTAPLDMAKSLIGGIFGGGEGGGLLGGIFGGGGGGILGGLFGGIFGGK